MATWRGTNVFKFLLLSSLPSENGSYEGTVRRYPTHTGTAQPRSVTYLSSVIGRGIKIHRYTDIPRYRPQDIMHIVSCQINSCIEIHIYHCKHKPWVTCKDNIVRYQALLLHNVPTKMPNAHDATKLKDFRSSF